MDGGVFGHEVGNGRADGTAADVVFAGKTGDGLAFQVRGACGGGLRCRDDWASAVLVALRLGGRSPSYVSSRWKSLGLDGADPGGARHTDDLEDSIP
ncbi:hypothetical protein [Streptomyces lydicus]|uniref:hypothetical protein n=1 Tax=Streptomyces lydicus TaxID=47763 RepID=UPI003722AFDF